MRGSYFRPHSEGDEKSKKRKLECARYLGAPQFFKRAWSPRAGRVGNPNFANVSIVWAVKEFWCSKVMRRKTGQQPCRSIGWWEPSSVKAVVVTYIRTFLTIVNCSSKPCKVTSPLFLPRGGFGHELSEGAMLEPKREGSSYAVCNVASEEHKQRLEKLDRPLYQLKARHLRKFSVRSATRWSRKTIEWKCLPYGKRRVTGSSLN